MDKAELAISGAAAAVVDRDQVKRLILVAQTAWRMQTSMGITDDTFDVWRRGVLWDAVRKTSFRQLGQREYGRAMDKFLELGGRDARGASNAWARTNERIATRETSAEGDRRRALHKLRETCAACADAFGGEEQALAYAKVLLQTIHKLPKGGELEQATAKQIWATVFTLTNRAGARRKKNM